MKNRPYHPEKKAPVASSYAWIVLGLCALFVLYKYILQVSPSVMANELMTTFHLHGVGLGNLAATFFYSYLVAQLFVGPLLDRYSPRLLTAIAIAVCGIGAIAFAYSHTLAQACLARLVIGMGVAFATVNYLKLTTLWFAPRQYAFVGGLLATACMVGSMTGQLPLAYFVSTLGWQTTLLGCGYLGLCLAVLYFLFAKDSPQPDKALSQTSSVNIKSYLGILKHRHNWLLTFYSGLAFSPLAVFGGLWGDPFLQQAYHLTRTQAASVVSMAFLGLGIGAPVFGLISDKLNNRFMLMKVGLFVTFVGLLCALYLPQHTPIAWVDVSLFLFGFGTGAFMLGFTVGKMLNQAVLAATVVGLINTGDAIFGAITEPFVGKILDLLSKDKLSASTPAFNLTDYHIAMGILPLYILLAGFFLWRLAKHYHHNAHQHNRLTVHHYHSIETSHAT